MRCKLATLRQVIDTVLQQLQTLRAEHDARRAQYCPEVRQDSHGRRYFVHACPHCETPNYQLLIDDGPVGYCEGCGAVTEWRLLQRGDTKHVLGFL